MTEKLIRQFKGLFIGYENAHGQHELFAEAEASGKIKGKARTVVGEAGVAEYNVHLKGQGTSLGLIPLLADNTCWFGAIDVDIKGEIVLRETIEELERRVRDFELPLVVCRSKSGGAHLYVFAERPITASTMQRKLTEFSSILGYGGCEVFPKQTTRVDENDRGNWINIPMYGSLSEEGTNRYAVRNGKPVSDLEAFCKYADAMRITERALMEVKVKMGSLFADGPPCLQHLATFGIEEGGRNVTLTNVSVYLQLKDEDNWQEQLEQFNQDHVHPPVDYQELKQIKQNKLRNDFRYTCKNPPLCNHCDKKLCITREYGVTAGSPDAETFELENLTRCISKDSVRWYAEHQGCRVELTTDQLMNPMELQKIFIEKFTKVIIPGKKFEWHERLRSMMDNCTDVVEPDDASVQGQFENLLDNFFNASRPARNKDELMKGNSYTEAGRVYFRSEDLFNYLNVRRFSHKPHDVWIWLKNQGATASQMRIKGKLIRVWSLPEPERFDGSDISMPTQLVGEM